MKQLVWFDGKFITVAKATVPLLTHSLHYGSAVFEGIRFYKTPKGPAIFRLPDHIKRLFFSARTMGMKIPFSEKEIIGATTELVRKNKLTDGYIRPIAWYGEKMGLYPKNAPLHIAIACWSWGKYLKKESASVCISKFARIHPRSSVMTAKISGHYANSVLASLEARKKGYDEALLLDWCGNIAEGPGENIFFVRGNTLTTPPSGSILPGITRNSVITIAKDISLRVQEKNIKPKDLRLYNEAFFTGTAVEIHPIEKIDKIAFQDANGKITKQIKEIFFKAVRGEVKKYRHWLTFC